MNITLNELTPVRRVVTQRGGDWSGVSFRRPLQEEHGLDLVTAGGWVRIWTEGTSAYFESEAEARAWEREGVRLECFAVEGEIDADGWRTYRTVVREVRAIMPNLRESEVEAVAAALRAAVDQATGGEHHLLLWQVLGQRLDAQIADEARRAAA